MTEHPDDSTGAAVADPPQREHPFELPAKILVVDDDAGIRLRLSAALRPQSRVIEATNGVRGLELLHAEQPDFMITDLRMPVMDGLELLRLARGTFIGAGIPIVMLTSEEDTESLFASFGYGVDDYLTKPFSLKELKARVSSIYLRQRRARDVNPLTRLPGNLMLKSEIERRLGPDQPPVAIAYIDLDHFKAFNDYQGFDRGDDVIAAMAEVLKSFAADYAPGTVFVGHVGGDDFVLILPPDRIDELGEHIDTQFTAAAKSMFTAEDWHRGFFEAENRQGERERFELLSVSVGVVTTERAGLTDLRMVAQVAAEVKKSAKAIPGNSLFVDRRRLP